MLSASFEDGEARGIEKGKIEGKTEGIAEVAKNMKGKGSDVAFISEVTGLSVEEIEKL
jgi:predicted transposase/invertase (TIGR01784 family)